MFKTAFWALLPVVGAVTYMTVVSNTHTAQSITSLTDENFAQWRDFIRPKPDESRWQEIPWRSSLMEAASEAQRLDKPILLWAMNGHPLACT
jgi:hypothetical protein